MRQKGIIEMHMANVCLFFVLFFLGGVLTFSYFFYAYKAQQLSYFSSSYLSSISEVSNYNGSLDKIYRLSDNYFPNSVKVVFFAEKKGVSKNGVHTIFEQIKGDSSIITMCNHKNDDLVSHIPIHATVDIVTICIYSPDLHVSALRTSFFISKSET